MISSPFVAVTSRPSRVKVRPVSAAAAWSPFAVSVKGAPPFLDVHEELVAEHADARGDGRRDGRPEHADRRLLRRPGHARRDVVAQVHEEIEIFLATGAALNSEQDALEPSRALPARGALAARLAREELRDPPGGADRAGGRVHDDDGPRAEHGAGVAHLVLPEREVHLVRPEPRGRDATGNERLERVRAPDAPAEHGGVDEVAECRLDHLELVVARLGGGP